MKSWIRVVFFRCFLFKWYVLFYTCWSSEFSTMHFALGEFIESMNINISRITGFIALSQFLCASSLFLGLKQTIRGFSPVFFKMPWIFSRHDDIPGDCTLQCLRSDFKRKWRIPFIASPIEEAGLHHFKPLLEGGFEREKKRKKIGRKQLMFDEFCWFVDCHVDEICVRFFFKKKKITALPGKTHLRKNLSNDIESQREEFWSVVTFPHSVDSRSNHEQISVNM